jgi:hypothetical protein
VGRKAAGNQNPGKAVSLGQVRRDWTLWARARAGSFDDRVSAGEQRWRMRDAGRVRGIEV